MTGKPYILLIESLDRRLTEITRELQGVRLVLGQTCGTLVAWEKGAALGFFSDQPAQTTLDRIKRAIGERFHLLVWELGSDSESWGFPHHHQWVQIAEWQRRRKAEDDGKF